MQQIDWTSKQRELVEQLLSECEVESRHYVESKRFRKRNFSSIQDVDALVSQGFIQDKNSQYSVDVLCLLKLESDLALKIRSDADLLWQVYHDEYLRDESDRPFLSTVAKTAGVAMDDAQRALHYMMQTNWHRGYDTPADGLYNSVVIGEEVLKYGSFSDYLTHLYKQYSESPRWSGTLDVASYLREANEKPSRTQTADEADLPAWVNELSEGVQALMKETFQAKAQGWNRLAAMGCRTLFDLVSTEVLSGDAGALKAKLDAMLREEHLAPAQHANLDAMVNAGNAVAHRGFNPSQELVETMWEIALNALHSSVLRPKVDKLRSDTPARPPPIKP